MQGYYESYNGYLLIKGVINIKIGFIGAGKVGVSLGKFFSDKNFCISGYFSKKKESAIFAANFTDSEVFENLQEVLISCDIIFVTTNDDSIGNIWQQLSELSIQNKIVCHCSGSLSSDIFNGISALGAYGCSVHPMLAFADKIHSYKKIQKAFFTLEGSPIALEHIKNILDITGNKYKIISAEDKIKYHLACCFVSNFSVALGKIGADLLSECGFDSETAVKCLSPLMLENAANISEKGIINSLTGPIERNDVGTVKKHLSVLNENNMVLYKLLSQNLIELAERKNKTNNYSLLKEVLTK